MRKFTVVTGGVGRTYQHTFDALTEFLREVESRARQGKTSEVREGYWVHIRVEEAGVLRMACIDCHTALVLRSALAESSPENYAQFNPMFPAEQDAWVIAQVFYSEEDALARRATIHETAHALGLFDKF